MFTITTEIVPPVEIDVPTTVLSDLSAARANLMNARAAQATKDSKDVREWLTKAQDQVDGLLDLYSSLVG